MTERSAQDDALMEAVETVRRDLVDLDFGMLTEAWKRLALIDATPEFRAQVAEQCLVSARRLTDLAQQLTQPIEGGT